MKEMVCKNCGSTKFHKEDGVLICDFCETRYYLSSDDKYVIDSSISLNEDVSNILKKWEKDPDNGKKYAQLILQIDSSNRKAREELAKYQNVGGGGCYIATCVYGSYDCPEVWTLRRFRDIVLADTIGGRLFIKIYYATSPTIVQMFGKKQWFNRLLRPMLNRIVNDLQTKGFDNTPYID